jgi:pimeloyl-ACP methyl ester carboxylesterase
MADGLPDLRRPNPLAAGAPVLRQLADAALASAWRGMQPGERGPFLKGEIAPLDRLHYRADDGWEADLFHLPAVRGGGEPVLLAHGLGGSHRDFSLAGPASLATCLREAGFSVYLLETRGDPSGVGPSESAAIAGQTFDAHDFDARHFGAHHFDADDIALRDLPAALDRVLGHSGFARALFVGHGFGAQLWCLAAGVGGEDRVAAATLLAPAVRFRAPASALLTAGLVANLLPPGWALPTRRVQQLATPFVHGGADLWSPGTDGALARGRLRHGSADLHAGVLRQVARWISRGELTDRSGRLDVVAALRPLPAQVVVPDLDPACPPWATEVLVERLGAERLALAGGWGHLDPLLGTRAPTELFPAVVRFLDRQRRRCR